VDAARKLGPISPLVYGTNYGPWQNLTSSMMPYVEEAGFTFLRFPGGNWGDEYLLTEQRFDEFIAMARQLNAEPMANVKLYKARAERAAGWVEYANVTRQYGVKYWGIGNEPSLYASNRGLSDYDTAEFNRQWREFALAMKSVDPSILLIGPETHQYTGAPGGNPRDQHGKDWMREFLIANGDLVDIVSFHRYPFGSFEPQISDLRQNSAEWDITIPTLRALIRQTTGRDLSIAVTEVSSNWTNQRGGEATPDSFYNAIWWADVLGRLIVQRVDIVAQFALEGAGGLGLMGYPGPRPTYYVYLLYKQFGSELIYAASDDPLVRIYAARRADGALTVIVINLGSDEATKPLELDNASPTGPAEVWRLDADRLTERTGEQAIASGDDITLPAQSISLYIFPRW
jgi:alpha-L-arabinofuranosidase